jgi:NAD(P)-dependent dehydrogenase (short-subunit alcohol dehydrogenase family)
MSRTIAVIGGSRGLGRHIAEHFARQDYEVLVTSRDAETAEKTAAEIGGRTTGLAVDLCVPGSVARAFARAPSVDHLVITAIEQVPNTVESFDFANAVRATTAKVVGYTEAVHALKSCFAPGGSVVLFGGLAKDRPYPGSTIVTATNGAVSALVRTLAVELAPIRFNALHPGVVGDSPQWRDKPKDALTARTPIGRTVTMAEVTEAAAFLLTNTGVNAANLYVDGGFRAS